MSEEKEETLWEVQFENDEHQPVYVQAPGKAEAWSVTRRMFDRQKYDFDFEEVCELTETSKRDPREAVKGDRPFRAIVPHKYHMTQYEKRVNQGGFKGVYQTRFYY